MSWTVKKTNQEIVGEAGAPRSILNRIKKWQASFLDTMRKEGLEHLITTGKLKGKGGRNRQRKKILDSLASPLNTMKVTSTTLATKD